MINFLINVYEYKNLLLCLHIHNPNVNSQSNKRFSVFNVHEIEAIIRVKKV